MFSYKKHNKILAVCDESLIGKIFEEDELIIEITKDFYHDEKCNSKEIIELIRKFSIVNAVGKKIIELLIKEKLIDKDKILKIKGIPHVQIIKL